MLLASQWIDMQAHAVGLCIPTAIMIAGEDGTTCVAGVFRLVASGACVVLALYQAL